MSQVSSKLKYILLTFGLFVCLTIGWVVGQPLKLWGAGYVNYDDSEYIINAIDTQERLDSYGLIKWPKVVFQNQHYGKPPLLVNSIAGAIEVTGSSNPLAGARWALMINTFILMLAVFAMMWIAIGPAIAAFSCFVVFSVPSVATWSTKTYPEIQMVAIIVCFLSTLMVIDQKGISKFRKILLGIFFGLGMLSKSTFPLFLICPVIFWMLRGGPIWVRLRQIFPSFLIGGVLASVWYVPNFHEAIIYVMNAASFVDDPDILRSERFFSWLKVLFVNSIGYIWLIAFLFLIVSSFMGHVFKRTKKSEVITLVTILISAALPMLFLALISNAPANTRHPLPAILLLVLAIGIILFEMRQVSGYFGLFSKLLIVAVVFQALGFGYLINGATSFQQTSSILKCFNFFNPGFEIPQRIDDHLAKKALAAVIEDNKTVKAVYLAGHNGSFHVPKLNLLAKLEKSPVRFDYGTYFSWDDDRVKKTLNDLLKNRSIILFYRDKNFSKNGVSRYFYRHQLNSSGLLEDAKKKNYSLELVEDTDDYQLLLYKPSSYVLQDMNFSQKYIGVDFVGGLRLVSVARSKAEIIIRILNKHKILVNYKLMIHAMGNVDSHLNLTLDKYIEPPFSDWAPGSVSDVILSLPSNLSGKGITLELGFFDEADKKNNWPRLSTLGGQDHVLIHLP
jgi:hypothetical protein